MTQALQQQHQRRLKNKGPQVFGDDLAKLVEHHRVNSYTPEELAGSTNTDFEKPFTVTKVPWRTTLDNDCTFQTEFKKITSIFTPDRALRKTKGRGQIKLGDTTLATKIVELSKTLVGGIRMDGESPDLKEVKDGPMKPAIFGLGPEHKYQYGFDLQALSCFRFSLCGSRDIAFLDFIKLKSHVKANMKLVDDQVVTSTIVTKWLTQCSKESMEEFVNTGGCKWGTVHADDIVYIPVGPLADSTNIIAIDTILLGFCNGGRLLRRLRLPNGGMKSALYSDLKSNSKPNFA